MKNISIIILAILLLTLTACSGNAKTTVEANAKPAGDTMQELPQSTQLAIGTLKLEETDQAITPDQAADMLPLWQVLNSLTSSDNAAQGEIDAIVEQIQDTMSPEQQTAIEGMEITNEDMATIMQELGLTIGFGEGEGVPPDGFTGGQGPGSDIPGTGQGRTDRSSHKSKWKPHRQWVIQAA